MSEEIMTVDITSQHIVINRDRSVAVPSLIKKSIVQRDHNIERLTFDCPRYWYGKDISTLNIYVNYISVIKKAKGEDPGSSLCENVVIDENDQDILHFDWIITDNVSEDMGGLIFLVCAKSVDSDGNEDVHWNSHLCKEMEVQEGLEASSAIVKRYPDVIESILSKLGKQIELRNSGTAIQYRNAGENTWVDLVQLEDIRGEDAVIIESNFQGSDTTANILAKTGETGDKWYSTNDGVYYMFSSKGEWINCGSGENLKKIEDEINEVKDSKLDKPAEDGNEGQVLTNGSDGTTIWKTVNIEINDGEIISEKLSGVKVNSPYYAEFVDYRINSETGAIEEYSGRQVSSKIPVIPGDILTIGGWYKNYDNSIYGAFYTSDDTFISIITPTNSMGNGSVNDIEVPDNASYARIMVAVDSTYLPTDISAINIGNIMKTTKQTIETNDEMLKTVIGQYAGGSLPDKSIPFSALNMFKREYYNKILWHTRVKRAIGWGTKSKYFSDIEGENYYRNGTYKVDVETGIEYRMRTNLFSNDIYFVLYDSDGKYIAKITSATDLQSYCDSYETETINYESISYFVLSENIAEVYICFYSETTYATTTRSVLICKRSEYDEGKDITYSEWICTDSDFADAMASINNVESSIDTLAGKVAIFLGDSYTAGMKSQLDTMCSNLGMVSDNRGVVSSTVSGTSVNDGSIGLRPMWERADGIVSNYTSGYNIDGITYTVDDVAVIVFMGGANDGFGPETWIGSGLNDTSMLHIYGATKHILNVLSETFTSAKVITVLQPSSYNRTVSSVTDEDSAKLMGFSSLEELQAMTDVEFSNYAMALKENAIEEVARAYQCPIIDCFHDYPSIFNSVNRSKYWNSDKLHLTTAGYYIITNRIKDEIIKLYSK